MGIDLGLAAVDSYARADDARVLREQQRQMFDWQRQKQESELALLPEKQAAQKSGYQLQNANNTAALEVAPNHAKVAKALSDYAVEDLPHQIGAMRRQGVFSEADAQTAGIAKLGDLIQLGDHDQIVNFLNGWRKSNPSSMQTDVAKAGFAKDPETGENTFYAVDAQGNPVMKMPASQISRAKNSIGKTDLKVVKPGEQLVGVKGGKATTLFNNPVDPALVKGLSGGAHPTANIQDAEWVMKNRDNPQAMAAWKEVRSSRGGKAQFVQNMIGKTLMGRETPEEIRARGDLYGALYDEINARYGDATPARSSGQTGAAISPDISTLLGLPTQ